MFFNPTAVEGLEGVWEQEVTRKDTQGNPNKGRGKHARGPVAVVVAVISELGSEEEGPYIWIIDGT
eukprot:14082040-Heterocapsa_arctica.AAC.1